MVFLRLALALTHFEKIKMGGEQIGHSPTLSTPTSKVVTLKKRHHLLN